MAGTQGAVGAFPEARPQEDGRTLLALLYGAMRALEYYPVENDAVQGALNELHGFVEGLANRDGTVELQVVGDFFFLNEERLRLDLRNYSTFGAFAGALARHGMGGVTVEQGVTREEWAPFLSLLLGEPKDDDPYEAFQQRLEATPVRSIRPRARKEVRPAGAEEEAALESAQRTYAQSVRTARGILTDLRMGRAVNVRKVKRAVQSIVDQVLSNEPSVLAMTTLKDLDEHTFVHSVNVCIFSVLIGQRIGLDRTQLYELGLGALLHDVGKARVGADLVAKEGPLDEEEWKEMQEHPTEGLLQLFHLHGFNEVPYRQMLMAYEHHMKVDLSGYPRNRRPRTPGLFSRIVGVADGFDAGTSVRSYQYKPWTPDEVLKEMRDNPRRGFDPILVKALMTATGVYPVGTLVILDTMEMGVVVQANPDPERLHQPKVKIISDPMGGGAAEPRVVELDEEDPATGRPRRSIIKTANAERYGVRVSDYIT